MGETAIGSFDNFIDSMCLGLPLPGMSCDSIRPANVVHDAYMSAGYDLIQFDSCGNSTSTHRVSHRARYASHPHG